MLRSSLFHSVEVTQPGAAGGCSQAESLTQPNEDEEANHVRPVSPQTHCILRLMAAGVRSQKLRNIRVGMDITHADPSGIPKKLGHYRPWLPARAHLLIESGQCALPLPITGFSVAFKVSHFLLPL